MYVQTDILWYIAAWNTMARDARFSQIPLASHCTPHNLLILPSPKPPIWKRQSFQIPTWACNFFLDPCTKTVLGLFPNVLFPGCLNSQRRHLACTHRHTALVRGGRRYFASSNTLKLCFLTTREHLHLHRWQLRQDALEIKLFRERPWPPGELAP